MKDKKSKRPATSRFTIYKVNKASRKKREKNSAKRERKATKTLAIVLGKSGNNTVTMSFGCKCIAYPETGLWIF